MPNSNNVPKLRPEPPPLPAKREDFIELIKRSLNDEVRYLHPILMEDEQYRKYLTAIWPEGAVEGSLEIDDAMAAIMIRDYGRTNGIKSLAEANLASIRHSLRVVCNFYKMSRKQRRDTVLGVKVEQEDEENIPDYNNNGLE